MSLSADCHLNESDWEFVKKLARIGHVNVLTSQVNITFFSNDSIGSSKDKPLIFPQNWSLQYVFTRPGKNQDHHPVSLTFEVLKK